MIDENYDFDDFDVDEDAAAVEVCRNEKAILYETSYVSDGCPISALKDFFPDFKFDENKDYLIEIDGEIYTGDTFEDFLLND